MNKRRVINEVLLSTGVEPEKCNRIFNSLETILKNELEKSDGIRNAFDSIYILMELIKNRQEVEITNLIAKTALASDTAPNDCQKVVNTLVEILNKTVETSKVARFKFDTTYKFVNLFRNK